MQLAEPRWRRTLPKSREEISTEIDAILRSGLLDPGYAGKLKGKLTCGVGRAFLCVISERQYLRFPIKHEFSLDLPLIEALKQWKMLVNEGFPRRIEVACSKPADVVIFTDGFTPDFRATESLPDRVVGSHVWSTAPPTGPVYINCSREDQEALAPAHHSDPAS